MRFWTAVSAGPVLVVSRCTKYLNQIFTVTREIIDPFTGQASLPADYSELGILLISVTAVGLLLPTLTIVLTHHRRPEVILAKFKR